MNKTKYTFDQIFKDITSTVTKIPKTEYLEEGDIAIIDQSKSFICGYVDDAEKICFSGEKIIFGDHTRVFKYIDFPFVIGADGVHVLEVINENINPKYIYFYLLASYIPNEGYSRHFKWVKKLEFYVPGKDEQDKIVEKIEIIENQKKLLQENLEDLEQLFSIQLEKNF